MNDQPFTYHPVTGVPLRSRTACADREESYLKVQWRVLIENIERCTAQAGQPPQRYRRSAEGHVRVR